MATESDSELLRRFTDLGDEQAFCALARRYSGLVYHTALRSTGDAELARDVCQAVFLALARKAKHLDAARGGLAGWLHRAAVFEASNACKRERRRQRALHELETSMRYDPSPGLSLHPALPYLDHALERLPEPDRDVLLAHYFQGWTYGEIAQRRNESEAAVQRRASRAVEKLSVSLRRAGVVVPTALLAAELSAVLQTPAPANGISVMSHPSPSAAQGVWLGKVAALVVAGGLSGAASYALSDAPQPPSMPPAFTRVERLETLLGTRLGAAMQAKVGPRAEWQVVVRRAMEALRPTSSDMANARAAWHLKSLTFEELKSALLWAKELPTSTARTALASIILSLRATENPALAWTEQCENFDGDQAQPEPMLVQSGERIVRLLWQRDPMECLRRLPTLESAPHLEQGAQSIASSLMEDAKSREMVCHQIEKVADPAMRAKSVAMASQAGRPEDMVPWVAELAFQPEEARRVPIALLTSRLRHNEKWDATLTVWLEGLPPEKAASARRAICHQLLECPEVERLELAKSLTDPVLRLAVQKSL